VLEVGYVGSNGINLTDYNHNYNSALLASPSRPVNGLTTTTAGNLALRTPYLGFLTNGLQGSAFDGVSNYNSLQVTVRKQLSRGFSLQGAYTFSKSLTNIYDTTANSNDANNLAQQMGPSNFNRPQRLVLNYSWDLPFGKHKGVVGGILGGWNLSGVTTIQKGVPLTLIDSRGGTAYNVSGTSVQSGYSRAQLCPGKTYADIASSGDIKSRLGAYFNGSAFCAPPSIGDGSVTAYGNAGVGILQGPGQFNFDTALLKSTRIREGQTLQFRAEFFNMFNHAQFSNPGAAGSLVSLLNVNTIAPSAVCPGGGACATAGRITSTAVNPRVIQFGLKYIF